MGYERSPCILRAKSGLMMGCGYEQKAEKAAAVVVLDDGYKNANPGDTATTKGILDDAVVQSFEDAGFAEDHRLSNLKLFLGALACAFALVAQVSLKCVSSPLGQLHDQGRLSPFWGSVSMLR
jgi:hypothetical protein